MAKIYLNKMPFKCLVFSLTLIYSLVYPITNAADPKSIDTIGKVSTFSSIQNLTTDRAGIIYALDQTPQSTIMHKIDGHVVKQLNR